MTEARAAPAPGGGPVRLLTFSTLYPNAIRPQHGVFVETRLRHLVAQENVEATVLAPIPWYPAWGPELGRWKRFVGVAGVERRQGFDVHHPRFASIPRIGMNVAPATLAAAALAWLARLPPARRRAFDLVDAHYVYPDGVAAVAVARALGAPLVITARGSDLTELPDHAVPRRLIRWALGRADGLIAVSGALGARMRALGAPAGRVRVLRNGVDLAMFRPPADRAASRMALGFTGPTLVSVGHLIARKGHGRVIEALARLPEAIGLAIVGEGPLEAELRALAVRLGVAGRVRFLGLLPPEALPAVLGAADVLVLASSREGWANVLLEAMACGTPVVASPIAGNDEVVGTRGEAGLLAATNDGAGIAASVVALLDGGTDRVRVRGYAERFGWEATSAGQAALFRELLDRRGGRVSGNFTA